MKHYLHECTPIIPLLDVKKIINAKRMIDRSIYEDIILGIKKRN